MFNFNQKGFSLLGVIVSMFIIMVGLTSVLSLANMSLKGTSTSKMRLIATGLAQEGVEIIRYMRETQSDWDTWYSEVEVISGDYRIQYDNSDLSDLVAFSDIFLKLDSATGLYQYDSGDDTIFKRKVSLTSVSAVQVNVVVEIIWQLKDNDYSLAVESRLWNWK